MNCEVHIVQITDPPTLYKDQLLQGSKLDWPQLSKEVRIMGVHENCYVIKGSIVEGISNEAGSVLYILMISEGWLIREQKRGVYENNALSSFLYGNISRCSDQNKYFKM